MIYNVKYLVETYINDPSFGIASAYNSMAEVGSFLYYDVFRGYNLTDGEVVGMCAIDAYHNKETNSAVFVSIANLSDATVFGSSICPEKLKCATVLRYDFNDNLQRIGQRLTDMMVEISSDKYISGQDKYVAADMCFDYLRDEETTLSWYLPSAHEWILCANSVKSINLSMIGLDGRFWCANQYDEDNAYAFDFDSMSVSYCNKGELSKVRAFI